MEDYVVVEITEEFKELMDKIFNDEFMKKHTTFENFEGFRYSSAVMTNWESDKMIYSQTVFDNFIKESTEYSSWDEMVRAAADEAFGKAD